MSRVMVEVPDGHAVQVHPPVPSLTGMIHDPAIAGAKKAMDAALPAPGEQTKTKAAPEQPKRKSKTPEKKDGKTSERQMGGGGNEKTAR
jgi:ribosomal protein L12E/L44/L45/RPP1/RPP2